MRCLLLIVILFIASVAIDLTWFTFIAGPYYVEALGSLLRQSELGFTPNLVAAIAVYLLLILGIVWFVLPKASGHYTKAAFWGGAYGLVIYGIYDFTNYATLMNWPGNLSVIDVAWGIVFCGIMSVVALALQKKIHC